LTNDQYFVLYVCGPCSYGILSLNPRLIGKSVRQQLLLIFFILYFCKLTQCLCYYLSRIYLGSETSLLRFECSIRSGYGSEI